jgi:hypothetical protein
VKRVPRHRRLPAPFLSVLSGRALRSATTVPAGTTASQFIALGVPRPVAVQRHHPNVLRSVALRLVAYACRNSPRNTLQGVLANLRLAARRKTFARISERLADRSGGELAGRSCDRIAGKLH